MELWDVYDKDRNLTGRTHVRGVPLAEGDYHLVVHVWIENDKGQYLISKRTPNKSFPNLWECTGGSAVVGDTSEMAALREVEEELGIKLDPRNGTLILSNTFTDGYADIWLFRENVDISKVVFQETETCDAKWAMPDEIREMVKDGSFVPVFEYLEWLFARRTPTVSFDVPEGAPIRYAVTVAKHNGKWVFVRHRDRDTLEFPGGHIEIGETPLEAAKRELREESGAEDFDIWPVSVYSVTRGNVLSRGALFLAVIRTFGEIPKNFEMAERVFVDEVPKNATYPEIIPKLMACTKNAIEQNATRIYFVRHAQSDVSVRDDRTRPLTLAGLQAADALVKVFEGIHLDHIYSSPYLRAMQTVQPLANARGLSITEDEDFRERGHGRWLDDWDTVTKKQWADLDYKSAGGESIREVQQRNIRALDRVLSTRERAAVVIGTHGCALSSILNCYDPTYGYHQFMALVPKTPCVMCARFIGKTFVDVEEIKI